MLQKRTATETNYRKFNNYWLQLLNHKKIKSQKPKSLALLSRGTIIFKTKPKELLVAFLSLLPLCNLFFENIVLKTRNLSLMEALSQLLLILNAIRRKKKSRLTSKRLQVIVNIHLPNSMETSSSTETVIKFSINPLFPTYFLNFLKPINFILKVFNIILLLLFYLN